MDVTARAVALVTSVRRLQGAKCGEAEERERHDEGAGDGEDEHQLSPFAAGKPPRGDTIVSAVQNRRPRRGTVVQNGWAPCLDGWGVRFGVESAHTEKLSAHARPGVDRFAHSKFGIATRGAPAAPTGLRPTGTQTDRLTPPEPFKPRRSWVRPFAFSGLDQIG